MKRALICSSSLLVIVAGLFMSPARAEEQILWASSLDEAWELAQEHDRPMLVFITRSGCSYCTKMKTNTFRDPQVAKEVNGNFVPVAITPATGQELIQKLQIRSYPTTLIISPDYYLVDQIKGYSPPSDLYRRLNGISPRLAEVPPDVVR